MPRDFKLTFNLAKTIREADSFAYIEGMASGTEVDLTGERMSVQALQSMVNSLKKGVVEFRSEHSHEWDAAIGELTGLSLNADNKPVYKVRLDLRYSKATDLLHGLKRGRDLGVSIGGQIVKVGYEYVEDFGKLVFTYFDILLKEISITGTAAYPYGWINQVPEGLNTAALGTDAPI